jgi:hypothetical protein
MELGLTWFKYAPTWKGNRDLPESEQLSLEIKRLRPVDTLYEESEESINQWRDEQLKRWINDPDYGDAITQMPLDVLRLIKRFTTHTRKFENFVFGGEEKTDPVEIFLNIPNPTTSSQKDSLIMEIIQVLGETAHLTGEELKNYAARPDGSISQ